MAGEQGTMNADVGSFLDQLLKPTMQGQAQPQMRAMPIAPGTPQESPVQQGAMTPALPTVQQAQGQSLPLPPAYVEEADARGVHGTARDEVEGGVGANIPWGQIITATLGAGGAGLLLDSLLRGGGSAAPSTGPMSAQGTYRPEMEEGRYMQGDASRAPLQGDVIPPTQQRIPGTNPEPPTIDATKKAPVASSPAQLNAPSPINQLDEVMKPRLTEAPALPPAAIPLKDANNMKASLATQMQQGGMPQMASGEQAQVGKYYGDTSVPNTSKSPSFAEGRNTRGIDAVNEVLQGRGITVDQLPQSYKTIINDPQKLATMQKNPSQWKTFLQTLKTLKNVR